MEVNIASYVDDNLHEFIYYKFIIVILYIYN